MSASPAPPGRTSPKTSGRPQRRLSGLTRPPGVRSGRPCSSGGDWSTTGGPVERRSTTLAAAAASAAAGREPECAPATRGVGREGGATLGLPRNWSVPSVSLHTSVSRRKRRRTARGGRGRGAPRRETERRRRSSTRSRRRREGATRREGGRRPGALAPQPRGGEAPPDRPSCARRPGLWCPRPTKGSTRRRADPWTHRGPPLGRRGVAGREAPQLTRIVRLTGGPKPSGRRAPLGARPTTGLRSRACSSPFYADLTPFHARPRGREEGDDRRRNPSGRDGLRPLGPPSRRVNLLATDPQNKRVGGEGERAIYKLWWRVGVQVKRLRRKEARKSTFSDLTRQTV